MREPDDWRDRLDRRCAPTIPLWVYRILAVLDVLIMSLLYLEHPCKASAYLGLGGAVLATLGGFAMLRPMIRAGGYKAWLAKRQTIDGGSFEPTDEDRKESKEMNNDEYAVSILGPAMIFVGTIANGAAGLCS